MVPYQDPNTMDTVTTLKLNFKDRNLPEIFVNPSHYPDLVWQQQQVYDPNRASTATLLWDFQGLGTGISPPDPTGDADSLYYIQGTNAAVGGVFRIFNKTTGATVVASTTMQTLGGPSGLGDPIILYDKLAKRWFITEFQNGANVMVIHVSQTSNPQGAYYTYTVTCPFFPDYPKYAIWPGADALIISSNENGSCGIYAIKRSSLLTGGAITPLRTTIAGLPGFGFQSITPVDVEGDNTPPAGMKPLYMRQRDDESHPPTTAGSDKIEIWELTVTWPSTISVAKIQDLLINEFDSDLCGLTSFSCIQQPTASPNQDLDPLREPLLYKVPYRNLGTHQAIVMAFATDVTGANDAGVRWVEIRRPAGSTGTWTKYQEGTYFPDALNRWMPSINMDKNGNIMMAYSTSNGVAGNFPSLRYTGRRPCDPLGQMTVAETVIEAGASSRTSNTRWGDYHHMSIDPFDDVTFYFTGVYMAASNSIVTRASAFRMNMDVNDAKLVSAFSTTPPPICGSTATVGVIVKNMGSAAITGGTIKYQINGGAFTNQAYTPSPVNITTNNTDTVFFNLTGLVTGANTIKFVNVTTNGATPDGLACNDTTILVLNTVTSSLAVSSVITTPVLCNGGTTGVITVTATGGVPTLSYSLNGGAGQPGNVFSGLAPGTYTASVTEGTGCTMAATPLVIANPPAIVASGVITQQVSCFNGTNGIITITGSGGTGTLNYSINGSTYQTGNIFTGLAPGTYTVYVKDANNCVQTGNTLVLANPALLTSTQSQTNVNCFGNSNGTATVVASGGTPAYTYAWVPSGGTSATASGLAPNTYTCTITDSRGCTRTNTFTITQPATGLTASQSQVNVLCFGATTGTATVAASGGTPGYTYAWAPSGGTAATATGLAAGSYTCTITDASLCTTTKTFNITQPVAALSATQSQTNVNCFGQSTGSATVVASGGTISYSYAWAPSGGTAATATGLASGNYTCTITDGNGCTLTKTFNITQPASALSSTQSQTNVSCFGGANATATVLASGGTPGYTYAWAPSGGTAATATGLTANTYTCTITDTKGCTRTNTFTITQPASALSASQSQTNVNCFGQSTGSATVVASGGTVSYTYSWAPSGGTAATASSLAAGSYTCTITDGNGCTTSRTFNITQPASALSATQSQTNINCFGQSTGSATVVASGGTVSYTYNWAPSGGTAATASSLAAGSYTCTITDGNGCTLTKTFNLTQPASALASSISASAPATCGSSNGSATVTASGGTPGYTYAWAPSGGTGTTATGLAAGTYTVTVTDTKGCTSTSVAVIGSTGGPTASIASQVNVSCFGGTNGSVTLNTTGGTPGYTYVWVPNVSSTATATGLSAGTYVVTVRDANLCQSVVNVNITQPASALSATQSQTNVNCFGQSTGSATVVASGGTISYSYAWAPSGGTAATATGLASGNYTCTITDGNGCTTSKTFNITQPATVLNASQSQTNVNCFGNSTGSATVVASGGTAGYTYAWAPSGGTAATASGLVSGTYTCTITDAGGCTISRTFNITQPAAALSATQSQTNVNCFGAATGSATVVVSGGTVSYSYAWAPSGGTAATATGLVAGTYTCTVTDANGCTTSRTFNITQPATITATATQINASCTPGNNGAAQVTASGGTGTLTYAWAPSGGTSSIATGLAAGGYTVTVTDANGCTRTATTTIGSFATPVATISAFTNVTCNNLNNGTATVTASGGAGGYTYNWLPGGSASASVVGLSGGVYTTTVTDANGCTNSATVTIVNPPALNASAVVTQTLACANGTNGSITASASGGTGAYQYSLNGGTPQGSPVFTNLSSGVYNVTVTDANGCTQSAPALFIANPAPILVAAVINSQVTCNGSATGQITASAAGGTGALQYSVDGINFQASNIFTGLPAGTYVVTVTDANGCSGTSSPQTLTNPPVINAGASVSASIACNGGTGSITASATGGTGSLLYSIDGINFQTNPVFTGVIAGSYTITVKDANGCTATAPVNLTQPSPLTLMAGFTDVTCNGNADGTITLTASGGTGSLTYSIDGLVFQASNLFGSLGPNAYTAVVQDANGCSETVNITIAEPAPFSGNVIPADVTCNGSVNGEILVNISGGTGTLLYSIDGGANYQASNLFIGLAPGSYTVLVKDANGCIYSTSVVVNEPPVLTVVGLATDEQYGNDGTITINETGGVSAYTYSIDGTNYQPGNLFINLAPGVYTVYVMDDNGCIATNTVTIGSTLGGEVIKPSGMQLVNLYPNPTKGDFNLHVTGIKGNMLELRLYNTLGEAVALFKCDVSNGEVNQAFHLSHKIAVGSYFFAIYDGNEKPLIVKFIKH
jgi:hypothetical protein